MTDIPKRSYVLDDSTKAKTYPQHLPAIWKEHGQKRLAAMTKAFLAIEPLPEVRHLLAPAEQANPLIADQPHAFLFDTQWGHPSACAMAHACWTHAGAMAAEATRLGDAGTVPGLYSGKSMWMPSTARLGFRAGAYRFTIVQPRFYPTSGGLNSSAPPSVWYDEEAADPWQVRQPLLDNPFADMMTGWLDRQRERRRQVALLEQVFGTVIAWDVSLASLWDVMPELAKLFQLLLADSPDAYESVSRPTPGRTFSRTSIVNMLRASLPGYASMLGPCGQVLPMMVTASVALARIGDEDQRATHLSRFPQLVVNTAVADEEDAA